ncbi:MAG: hypothetical protein ACTHZ5_12000 [Micrococcaceae bacterium]
MDVRAPGNGGFHQELQGVITSWDRHDPTSSSSFTSPKTQGFVDVPATKVFHRENEWMRSTGISTCWEKSIFDHDVRNWTGEYGPLTP